jgi:hypothetical protein
VAAIYNTYRSRYGKKLKPGHPIILQENLARSGA